MNKNILKYNEYWRLITDNTGYDFSGYCYETLNRRLENFISSERIGSVDELKAKLYTDNSASEKILGRLLISYTEMFRDPDFFLSLRKNVLPFLSTYSSICIWHAGCSTGEEAYSLAILLDELNLLDKCEIYATDINEINLKNASRGIYPLTQMQESVSRYFGAGGKKNLSSYYTAYYDHVIFHQRIRDRIKFRKHNITLEAPIKKAHLILCRNVFIYFSEELQLRVMNSLSEGLHNYGYLGMGILEHFVDLKRSNLAVIDEENKIYRRVI